MILRIWPSNIRHSATRSVLNKRGWVLQEMVLSHRTVHCMRSQLQWHCRTTCETESGATFDSGTRHSPLSMRLTRNPHRNKIWWMWMESYSARSFTFPKDRFPALIGIIRHYQAATGDTAILGLWEGSFCQDLLWIRTGDISSKKALPPQLPNIPSWSWLSCHSEITFDYWKSEGEDEYLNIYDHATLVNWSVNWTGQPFLSKIESTHLIIEGPVREIVLGVAPQATDYNPPFFNVGTEQVDLSGRPIPWRCAARFDCEDRMATNNYLCLLLRSRVLQSGECAKETFLILEPDSNHKGKTMYQRVGLGNFRGGGILI